MEAFSKSGRSGVPGRSGWHLDRQKEGEGEEIQITLWKEVHHRQGLLELAEQYAGFRQQKLVKVGIQ